MNQSDTHLTHHLFIGVDGGATKCIVRIEDELGSLIGQSVCGPANIRISVDQAWQSINSCINKILTENSLALSTPNNQFHAGMGLAGCEMQGAYQAFLHHPHAFTTLTVTSDSYTACLGAHGGKDGAIIIAGTGVAGYQIQKNEISKVSGWGFPHDDEGSGAWLGLCAVKHTLQCLDGRLPESNMAKAVFAYFDQDHEKLVSWANQANSTAFAEIAPMVIERSQQGDVQAIQLLQQAAHAIDLISETLLTKQIKNTNPLPCALVGGIAPFLQPYLNATLRSRLTPCQSPPEVGAILLVRNHLANAKDLA